MLSSTFSRATSVTKRLYIATTNLPKRNPKRNSHWHNYTLTSQRFHHLTAEFKSIKEELKADMQSLKVDFHRDCMDIRQEMQELKMDVKQEIQKLSSWTDKIKTSVALLVGVVGSEWLFNQFGFRAQPEICPKT